jgi:hypothetical protein
MQKCPPCKQQLQNGARGSNSTMVATEGMKHTTLCILEVIAAGTQHDRLKAHLFDCTRTADCWAMKCRQWAHALPKARESKQRPRVSAADLAACLALTIVRHFDSTDAHQHCPERTASASAFVLAKCILPACACQPVRIAAQCRRLQRPASTSAFLQASLDLS